MKSAVSVAMTAATEAALVEHLDRRDGQEDLCLVTYAPSTGLTRRTALVSQMIAPEVGDRHVHGNATITAEYVLRGIAAAQAGGLGLALMHSHPGATRWQKMSGPDRDTESSYANLVRESTGLPLVGMTLATGDRSWSARHWNLGVGRDVGCTHATNVRVVADRLSISWNDDLCPPPLATRRQIRTISAWGERRQADLARQRVLVVGAGSVGLDIILRLMASGLCHLTVMDYDVVEPHNLDRMIGARARDARLRRFKTHVARREGLAAATAATPNLVVTNTSICEPEGFGIALDHDLIFSCVDRPWPRAVLNAMAYSDLIPVIDGGIALDAFEDGTMRNATWRSHVIRPQRPCMACNRQLDLGLVMLDKEGLLDDPRYIRGAESHAALPRQNVAPLAANVSATLLAQYTSYCASPGGLGDPGPLQYWLSTHHLEVRDDQTKPHCAIEAAEAVGDLRLDLTGRHEIAERQRQVAEHPGPYAKLLRCVDAIGQAATAWLDSHV